MRSLGFVLLAILVAGVGCGDFREGAVTDARMGPQCADTVDNDGDGTTDFPEDLGCEDEDDNDETGTIQPQCRDNRDNDGDGKIDYPNDPGCIAPQVDDETDGCPGANCPQCGDGQDNDNNGKTDFPDDSTSCASAADSVEFTDNPTACGQGMVIKPLPPTGTDMGMLAGTTSVVSSPCGGGNGLPAIAYVFHIAIPRVIVATTDDPDTAIDSVLDLRSSMCTMPNAELACHDDITPGSGSSANKQSTITRSLQPGTYYLIVGGKTAADTGAYSLTVTFLAGEDAPCGATSDCGPGLVCRIPVGQTNMVCSRDVCDDGRDDDGDGKMDYPNDPGCSSNADDSEDDTCNTNPPGPQCPECSNGIDDEGDGNIDYGADPNCHSASTSSEACAQSEDIGVITQPMTMGTTVGAVNDFKPSCGSASHTAPDVVYRLELPPMATLSLNLTGFSSAHALLDSTCGGTAIACSDPALMERTNVPAGTYYVVIDGASTASGTFTLATSGTVAAGGSCEGALFQAGAFTCAAGYSCGGTPGSRTCVVVACNDAMDNDGDGKTDFPADPGCANASGNDEMDDCSPTVGPNCPECADMVDNDGDGKVDYPADTTCASAAVDNEKCVQSETVIEATMPQMMGTTVGAVNDFRPPPGSFNGHGCSTTSTTTGTAPDVTYQLDVPAMETLSLQLSPVSYDSAHVLLNSTCGGTPIECYDSPTGMNLTNIARGRYYLVVDGFSSSSGTFTLNISGTIKGGESCESALAQSGAIQCGPGYLCGGTPGSQTCMPTVCNDGVDNDGDGKSDATDPGCTSTGDTDEMDGCSPVLGPDCPACSDSVDNDGDGVLDWPADASCFRPSEDSEACTHTEPLIVATQPQTVGTTVGAKNDSRPPPGSFNGHGCSTTSMTTATAPEVTVMFDVPAMQTISLKLSPVSYDSAQVLLDSTCGGTPIECYDSPTGMTLSNLAAGRHYLNIDGFSSGSGTFTLNVTGTIKPGESCEAPLAQSGAITCGTGYSCSGTPGSRRCLGQSACTDGMDNDGDGKTDYPFDPGCSSPTDIDELDDCYPTVGPNCPQCGNGIDDDLDMQPDFPADQGCRDASFLRESFCTADSEVAGVITAPATNGTFAGTTDDFEQSCQANTGGDVTYLLSLPVPVAKLQLDTIGSASDTVLSMWNSVCTAEVECDDDDGGSLKSLIIRSNVAAGEYAVEVDSYGTASNQTTYTLNVKGTVAAGTACTDPLFTSGVLVCAPGTTCTAGTCQ